MRLQALSEGFVEVRREFLMLPLQVPLALHLQLLYLVLQVEFLAFQKRNTVLYLASEPARANVLPLQIRKLQVLLAPEVGVFFPFGAAAEHVVRAFFLLTPLFGALLEELARQRLRILSNLVQVELLAARTKQLSHQAHLKLLLHLELLLVVLERTCCFIVLRVLVEQATLLAVVLVLHLLTRIHVLIKRLRADLLIVLHELESLLRLLRDWQCFARFHLTRSVVCIFKPKK